jgi:alkanesulfonate monooxygenase SsuD/methylene tetrahydromethanopterin reductase-like flavin-dependent oxidoreductase (luciferase family)
MFAESMTVLRQALVDGRVDFAGEFYRYNNVPMELSPLQRPHPPFWYGVITPDSGERSARQGYNIVANGPAKVFRTITDRYRATYRPPAAGGEYPKLGLNRFVMLADTEADALAIARRAYKRWYRNFMTLWVKHNMAPTNVSYPAEIEGQIAVGVAVVGTPDKVLASLRAQIAESGANYLVTRFAYGDMTLQESLRSLDLFQRHVMPALREATPVAAE